MRQGKVMRKSLALLLLGITGFCGAENIKKTVDISSIDRNFKIKGVGRFEGTYYNVKSAPIALEGLAFMQENKGDFYRIPRTLTAREVNKGVVFLANHTSGACVRFRTDSPNIVIRAKLAYSYDMSHMTRAGSAGFDSYAAYNGKLIYQKTIMPKAGEKSIHALIGKNPDRKMRDWLINLPLYGGVESLEVGIEKNSTIQAPTPHRISDPVLFYGSSITQGGCASRPGNNYTSMLCRAVDAPQINLGFSGSARGEEAMAKVIGKLKMACFVYDYDHNAPTVKHLQKTHEKFFKIIRSMQPELPVIILSKCNFRNNQNDKARREVIRKTYENAVASGDKNVYFVDGETLFAGDLRDSCTVDGTHPNDLGFFRMYEHVLPVLKTALKIK